MHKKIILTISCIVLLLAFCSCDDSNHNVTELDNPIAENNPNIEDNILTENNSNPIISYDSIEDFDVRIIRWDQDGYGDDFVLEANVSAYMVNGVAMAPLQPFAEAFAYVVNVVEGEKKTVITDTIAGNEITLFIDSKEILANGETDIMPHAPVIKDGYVFIPVQYVSEFFGLHVYPWYWYDNSGTYHSDLCISEMQLLTAEDIAIDDNYELTADEITQWPYHTLKPGGKTARGIALYDSVDQLFIAYGATQGQEDRLDKGCVIYSYRDVGGAPWSGEMTSLLFHVRDGVIISIAIWDND